MAIDCDAQMVARTGVAVTRVPEPRRPPGPGQSGLRPRPLPCLPRSAPAPAPARAGPHLPAPWAGLGRQFGCRRPNRTRAPAAAGPSDPHSLLVCPQAGAHVCWSYDHQTGLTTLKKGLMIINKGRYSVSVGGPLISGRQCSNLIRSFCVNKSIYIHDLIQLIRTQCCKASSPFAQNPYKIIYMP